MSNLLVAKLTKIYLSPNVKVYVVNKLLSNVPLRLGLFPFSESRFVVNQL